MPTQKFLANSADAFDDIQASPESEDFEYLLLGHHRTGVLSGFVVTESSPTAQTVDVTAGKGLETGEQITGSASLDLAVSSADGSNPRKDLISINSAGTAVVTAGTPAAVPAAPVTPANSIPVAVLTVLANDNDHEDAQISDKRVLLADRYVFNVKDFGATGDGATDDTTAIQAAIDAAEADGGIVFVPPPDSGSFYLVTNLTVNANGVIIQGVGTASKIRSNTDHTLSLGTTTPIGELTIRDLFLENGFATGAALEIAGTVSQSLFANVRFGTQTTSSYCIFASGSSWSLLDSMFLKCIMDADASSLTVPALNFVDTAGAAIFNQNTWLGGRWIGSTGATAPLCFISVQGASYAFGNTFQGINIEIPIAGAIHVEGTQNLALRDLGFYDVGIAIDHMIDLGKHASGLQTINTIIDNVLRIAGTIGANYDIFISNASFSTVINSGAQVATTGKIDFSGFRNMLINPQATTLDGMVTSTVLDGRNNEINIQEMLRKGASGSPEGVFTGVTGSFFQRSDGALGTSLYYKASGTGNTGWRPVGTEAKEESASFTLDLEDGVVNIESTAAARVVTLPDNAAFDGKEYMIHRDGANIVTVNRAGSDTFDTGATSIVLGQDGDVLHIISIGDGVWKLL